MNDLLANMAEHHAERLAIMQESNVQNPVQAAEDDLHRCEVSSVIRRFYPDGSKAAEYFELVEKKRGHLAAKRLKDDVRAEWVKRRSAEKGRA